MSLSVATTFQDDYRNHSAKMRAVIAKPSNQQQQVCSQGLLLVSTTVAASGSILFGFDAPVISAITDVLRRVFALRDNPSRIEIDFRSFGIADVMHRCARLFTLKGCNFG